MTEVSFAELYKGQALFSDVESFLRPLGFKFYGFDLFRNRSLNFLDKKVNWSRERCIQADAFFIKDPLDENITKPLDKRSSAILITASSIFGFFELALELAESAYANDELHAIKGWINDISKLDQRDEIEELTDLNLKITQRPEDIFLHINRFVDSRRHRNDTAHLSSLNNLDFPK